MNVSYLHLLSVRRVVTLHRSFSGYHELALFSCFLRTGSLVGLIWLREPVVEYLSYPKKLGY